MAAVFIEITTRPTDDEDLIEVIEDVDELVESAQCSCNAGDDNPY